MLKLMSAFVSSLGAKFRERGDGNLLKQLRHIILLKACRMPDIIYFDGA